ncbi:kisspeptin 2 [Pungitius pungitius]|uniref:kisspeptin 2 n=1 Tax=Pungitius pungitius TaxID=134920 RepID=UPI002E0D4DD7
MMQLLTLVVVCGLMAGNDGGSVRAALPGFDSAQRILAKGSVLSALTRRTIGAFLADDANPCFSLRENEEQRQLLCNDRRNQFNFNPFGLRFGKRYIYRRAVKRARTNTPLSPPFSLLAITGPNHSKQICLSLRSCVP